MVTFKIYLKDLWCPDLADRYVVQCGGIHFFNYQTFSSCSHQQSRTITVIIVVVRGLIMTCIITNEPSLP